MNASLRHRAAGLIAAATALLLTAGLAANADAATMQPSRDGTYLTYQADNTTDYIGVIAHGADGSNYYCIEAGASAEYVAGQATEVQDSDTARRVAWLMDHYKNSSDDLVHAAIGLLAHDHFDLNPGKWSQHRAIVTKTHGGIEGRANELWKEAGDHTPVAATVLRTFAQGIRRGNVEVAVKNAQGALVAGAPYTVALQGPAQFGNKQAMVSGVSKAQPSVHEWAATGGGEVSASVSYERKHIDRVDSSQTYAVYSGVSQTGGGAVNFTVRKDFTPSITTAATVKVVDSGGEIVDEVTSGVQGENSNWVPGLALNATGWYFNGLRQDQLRGGMSANSGESAAAFLERLKQAGYRPSGYGAASFTGPDQKQLAPAITVQGGSERYRSQDSGGFGTWVWAFEQSKLSAEAKEYVTADVISPFLEIVETNSNRSKLKVQSSVTEHSAALGSELSDTITVSGFPEDHGSFTGDERFGFGPDRQHAQVSVWWSGDAGDPEGDERFRPVGKEAPKEDANHRRLGTWDFPAGNGPLRVGAGAEDAHGRPVTITAVNHGWYVFVWSFDGDDRVMPASSAYDDAWERTRVQGGNQLAEPSIVTKVDPAQVATGELFRDTARVTGDLEEGAYVEFTAYEPIAPEVQPGLNGRLVDAARVDIDHTVADQMVTSPRTSANRPGLVYWRATLFSAKGDILATHRLGVEDEMVRIVEKPEPELARSGSSILAILALALIVAGAGVTAFVLYRRNRTRSSRGGKT